MIRRVLLPSGPLWAAVAVSKSEESKTQSADIIKKEKNLICKPSALPIYTSLVDSGCKAHANRKPSAVAQTIEDGVRTVRQELSVVTDFYDGQKAHIDRYYVDAMKETQHIRNYLQEETNTLPRAGAIAVGSLAGVVLGVRGGFFKKLFYASFTGSAVASVCYPREAKKYATVAYNFCYGLKPGEERQKDLPKFPTTFGELKDNVVSLYNLAYDAAVGSKK